MRQAKNCAGFTMPELVITLGILAIVLSMAVPGTNSMIRDNRLIGSLNNMVTDVHLARSESVKRDVRVIMCRTNNPNAAEPACGGDAQIWTNGYIVFADDGNFTNNTYDHGTDVLLSRGQAAPSGVRIRTNGTWNNNLEFNPDGTTNENNTTAVMAICDDRGVQFGRQIVVAPNGIPRTYSGNIGSCFP